MSGNTETRPNRVHPRDEDDTAILEVFHALGLTRDEAIRRLATPLSEPILPAGQELLANMAAIKNDATIINPCDDPLLEGH